MAGISLFVLITLGLIGSLISTSLVEGRQYKRAVKQRESGIPSGDNDSDPDEKFVMPEGQPNDCINRKELEKCQDDCGMHKDCRRTAKDTECEPECAGMCKYLQMRLSAKCITNLVGFLSVYRQGEPDGKRIDGEGDDDKDVGEEEEEEVLEPEPKPKPMAVTSAPMLTTKKPVAGGVASDATKKLPTKEKAAPFGFNFPQFSPDAFGKK